MSRRFAVLAGIATGVAAVGLAAGTGVIPDRFGKAADPADAPDTLQTAAIDTDVGPKPVAGIDIASPDQTSLENSTDSQFEEELQARLRDADTRESALATERKALETQVAQLATLELSLREQTETLMAKTAALTERQSDMDGREAELDAREETLTQRLAALVEREEAFTLARATAESADDQLTPDQNALETESDGSSLTELVDPPAEESVPPKPRTFADGPITEVHFELNSAQLTPGAMVRAKDAAERVMKMNVSRIRIIGFTDRSGSLDYNRVLSKARADAVADIFVQSGLSRQVIEVVGMGEAEKLLPISTADGVSEPLNRCVGILVEEVAPL